MPDFEQLDVWRDSMRLAETVYGRFGQIRDFGFRDQICRSAVSIPSNIAEGSERGSNKDFVRFLRIALGSAAELRTQLYLAVRLEKIDRPTGLSLVDSAKKLSAQLNKLICHRSAQ